MKPSRILLFVSVVIGLIALLGEFFPAEGYELGSRHIGFASVHSLIDRHETTLVAVEPTETPELAAWRDSVAYYHMLVNKGDLRFWQPNPHYFDVFWEKASRAAASNQVLRVLHYGDSQIEMDHITSRVRSRLQEQFGGGGPGMLPFRTITPSLSIRQSTSGELIHLASFGDSTTVRSRGDYGPMMQCFRMASGAATVNLRAAQSKSVDDRVKHFSSLSLIFNNRGRTLRVDLADREHRATLDRQNADAGIGKLAWILDSTSNSLRINVSGTADLYCLLADDGAGVAVDNIPMRGCSGQQFTLVPEEKLREAYSQMNIGMIIMQFGGNSVPYIKTSKQISRYCTSLGEQIDHLHRCCPDACILFVGPSDMSTRLRGQMQTYSMLPELIDSLAATATRHGAAYWSIYHAMGGENSMPTWVRQGLAGQDYIHFSQRGADLMGDRLSDALNNLYTLYRLEKRKVRHNR